MKRFLLAGSIVVTMLTGCGGGGGGGGSSGGDSQAPVVTITSHSDGDTFTATHTVTVSGTASDNAGVDSLTVSVNGGTATPLTLSGSSFSTGLTFTSDSNAVVVTATDAAGNSSSATVNLYYVATGLLDTSFDSLGYYSFPDMGSHEAITALVIAGDGSCYMTGYVRNVTGTGYDIGVWHLLADGLPDSGFDGDGLALLAGPAGGTGHDFGTALALDSDGKIVVVGHSINANGDDDLVVARYNTDGTLDTTFGGDFNPADGTPDGFVVVDVSGSGSADSGSGIVIDSSGSIYVSGTTDAAGTNDFTVWKFTTAGVLDTTFAAGAGYISYDSGGADQANAITMDAAGRLLVTGSANGGMAIWRLTAAGVTDASFNGTGVAAFTSGTGYAITTDATGNIVVAGSMAISGEGMNMALWRYTSSGAIDTTFGGDYNSDLTPDGYVYHDGAGVNYSLGDDNGYAVAIDAAGNLLVAGAAMANHNGTIREDMAVWRFTSKGVLDTTFGDDVDPTDGTPDGYFTHNGAAGGNNLDDGKAIAVDSLGRIVVGGESLNALNNADATVWRLY